jgi:tRNA dimethylallyltransferase
MAAEHVDELPLVVIVGPTASGKTALAIELAKEFSGEIICADSRTVYKGMDIGTAKPSIQERAGVPHWGIDLVEPDIRFTAADFKQYAEQKITDIRAQGHIPFLVGGTGLYVDAVIFNYQFGGEVDAGRRAKLESLSLEELWEYCISRNIKLPENDKNKRYVIRAIEQHGKTTSRQARPISPSIIVGIATDKEVLRMRIENRIEQLLQDGVVEEAIMLGKKYGWHSEAMTGNIYPLIHKYLQGTMTLEELKVRSTTIDWRLAKRQLTWMRRNQYIQWCSLDEARLLLSQHLAIK